MAKSYSGLWFQGTVAYREWRHVQNIPLLCDLACFLHSAPTGVLGCRRPAPGHSRTRVGLDISVCGQRPTWGKRLQDRWRRLLLGIKMFFNKHSCKNQSYFHIAALYLVTVKIAYCDARGMAKVSQYLNISLQ